MRLVADRYRTEDGWSIEIVRLTSTPDRRDGDWLRIRYLGYYVQAHGDMVISPCR